MTKYEELEYKIDTIILWVKENFIKKDLIEILLLLNDIKYKQIPKMKQRNMKKWNIYKHVRKK